MRLILISLVALFSLGCSTYNENYYFLAEEKLEIIYVEP